MTENWTNKPRRLDRIFQTCSSPVYFVTAVTAGRRRILDSDAVHRALIECAMKNARSGRVMGRYVLMPDHMHFMVRLSQESRLSDYVRLLKQRLTKAVYEHGVLPAGSHVWQHGFFDRLLRSAERTSRAWEYMLNNPLQADLEKSANDWRYQGEIVPIRF